MKKKCPNCDDNMILNDITNTWDCPNCGFQLDNNNDVVVEEEKNDEKIISSDGSYTLNHCDVCDISFIGENIDNCFICNGSLNKSNINLDYSSFIDFKLNLGDAIHNYKKKLAFKLLVPISFRGRKTIKRLKGIYIPMYSFDVSVDGDIVFNASDLSVLDTTKKEKTTTYFKVLCNGHFDYEKVLINGSSRFKNALLEKIDDFDYSELKDINEFNLDDNIIYKEDCDSTNIVERLKNRCVNNSIKLMDELVNHAKSKVVDNQLDFKYDGKGIVLVPVYILENKYKDKKYYYIMNGQNGNTYIKTPIGIVETIIFSVLLFTISFVVMLLIAILI